MRWLSARAVPDEFCRCHRTFSSVSRGRMALFSAVCADVGQTIAVCLAPGTRLVIISGHLGFGHARALFAGHLCSRYRELRNAPLEASQDFCASGSVRAGDSARRRVRACARPSCPSPEHPSGIADLLCPCAGTLPSRASRAPRVQHLHGNESARFIGRAAGGPGAGACVTPRGSSRAQSGSSCFAGCHYGVVLCSRSTRKRSLLAISASATRVADAPSMSRCSAPPNARHRQIANAISW